jgi:hypothetical protein
MNTSRTVYQFPTLMGTVGSLAASAVNSSGSRRTAPAAGTVAMVSPLATDMCAAVFANQPLPDMTAAAHAGLVNLAEIESAAPYVQPGTDYVSWRDNWLFPMVDAATKAPEHTLEIRAIFDQVNRRTADPAKVQQRGETYFDNTQKLFDAAVAATVGRSEAHQTISHIRIFQNALHNGWNGRTQAHRRANVPPAVNSNTPATTVVAGPSRSAGARGTSTALTPFFGPVKFDMADLFPVLWLITGLLMVGEITVVVGQGGSAKTAFAICVMVALASGRQHIGPFHVNTRPGGLRVAFISAEEDLRRIGLLVEAACSVLCLTAAERAAVSTNLVVHDAGSSDWRLGVPPVGSRDAVAAESQDRGYDELVAALAQYKPDVLVLDTLAALFHLPSEIDNGAITTLMRRLARAARAAGCAVMLNHHTPKMTRETAAAQRGEPTLVRGGGAIANSARVVLSITPLPASEAAQAAMQGQNPDRVRRLEHAKINDMEPMCPAHFEIKSVPVRVHDGTDHAVRAVAFLPALPAASSGISNAARNLAMKAIDTGVLDDHGAQVPLSPGGGRNNLRDAVQSIARALVNATPSLAETHAVAAARAVLKDLKDRIGCVVEQDVLVPQYKTNGQPNGTRPRRGLVCRWDLAPWATTTPQPTTSGQQGMPGQAPAPEAEKPDEPPAQNAARDDADHGGAIG